MQIQLIPHPISSTRVRPEAGNWIDLFWKGEGWFHVFRDGEKIDVTCGNQSMSQKPGDFKVFREKEETKVMNTLSEIVIALNRALKLDPQAVSQLVFNCVVCNSEMVKDPDIQVRGDSLYTVGFIGILNAITRDYDHLIVACYDDPNVISQFALMRKQKTIPQQQKEEE